MGFTSDDYVPGEKARANMDRKLAGGSVKDCIMRWHRVVNQVSGGLVTSLGTNRIATNLLEYWMAVLLQVYWEMHDMNEQNKKDEAHARGSAGHGDNGDGPGGRGDRAGVRGAGGKRR